MKKNSKQTPLYKEPSLDDFSIWEDGEQLSLIDFDKFEKQPEKKKKGEKIPLNAHDLNDLNGSEWTIHGKRVQTFNSPITEKRRTHGAAFPIALAKHFIKIYSKPGDTIFWPNFVHPIGVFCL